MKILLTIQFFLVLSIFAFSQQAVATHEQITAFYKSTTCIVLDDDAFNVYNSAIQEAVKNNWTLTKYQFITTKQFKDMSQNPGYSFLIQTNVFEEKNPTRILYTFLSLVVGEKGKKFEELPEICSFPLSYYDEETEKYEYKIGALILFIQNHINLTYVNSNLNNTNILEYYKKNTSDIGTKEIYVIADELSKDVNSNSKISKYYKGKVKITTEEEIEKAISERNKNVVILHIVAPLLEDKKGGKCYKMLIGASDGKLYYFDSHLVTKKNFGVFLKQDFLNINKK